MISVSNRPGAPATGVARLDQSNTFAVPGAGADTIVITAGETDAPVLRATDGEGDWLRAIPSATEPDPRDAVIIVGDNLATCLGGSGLTGSIAPLSLEPTRGDASAVTANPASTASSPAGSIQYNATDDTFYVCLSDGWHAVSLL
jgi:hypothetical protein